MSFADSRSLVLDRQRPTELVLIGTSSVIAAGIPWLAPFGSLVGVISICALIAVLASWHAVGLIGNKRRIVQAIWDAEGRWSLVDQTGRFAATLDLDTRVFGAFAWLRWRSERGARQMVLWRAVLSPETNRHLSARLRLSKLQSDESASRQSTSTSTLQ